MNRVRFTPPTTLSVALRRPDGDLPMGTLALVEGTILFAFDGAYPDTLNPSPHTLRARPGTTVIPGPASPFEGLHGVFDGSLPDGWGRLLMDRKLRSVGIHPKELTPLDRLAWIGDRGMGALVYAPEHPALDAQGGEALDLDALALEARQVLEGSPEAVIDELLRVGGSPGGARPKALVGRSRDGATLVHGHEDVPEEYGHWLVKFAAQDDFEDVGLIELAYADMARAAGVRMAETALFPSKRGPGFFGMKRFDRDGGDRVHMLTLSAFLDADFRIPSVDYAALLTSTGALTRDQRGIDQMFTRMVFNVLAHNRDDHPKNHSFLMDGEGVWRVSPAYDVVFSFGPGGEHSLMVAGEGKNPGQEHLLQLAKDFGVKDKKAKAIIDTAKGAVANWDTFAKDCGVSTKSRDFVAQRLPAI